MDPVHQLDHVVPPLRALVAGTEPTQMANDTPCEEWCVRDLMNHLICGADMFAGAFQGEPTHDISSDLPDAAGDDHLGAFDRAVERFQSSLGRPGAMDRTIELPFGRLTVPEVLRYLAFDLTVHSWDLARATGQGFQQADPLLREIEDTARTMVTPEMRDGDTFAQPVPIGADARQIERVVSLAGRDPRTPVPALEG